MELVEIKAELDNVIIDLRYASNYNFLHQILYQSTRCFLHPEAKEKLLKAVKLAAQLDLKLKLFDGFRPLSIQQIFWDKNPDSKFISNPATGSIPHCRGIAIDLTLTDLAGQELAMGTDFDEFSLKAYHGNLAISPLAQKNRYILMGIMVAAGFDFYLNEWWHYQLFKPRDYPVINQATIEKLGLA